MSARCGRLQAPGLASHSCGDDCQSRAFRIKECGSYRSDPLTPLPLSCLDSLLRGLTMSPKSLYSFRNGTRTLLLSVTYQPSMTIVDSAYEPVVLPSQAPSCLTPRLSKEAYVIHLTIQDKLAHVLRPAYEHCRAAWKGHTPVHSSSVPICK